MTAPSPEERAEEAARALRRTEERLAPLRAAFPLPTNHPPAFAALLARLTQDTKETT